MSLFKNKNKYTKKAFKHRLNITQNKNELTIKGELGNEKYFVTALCLVNRENPSDVYELDVQNPSREFNFTTSLLDIFNKIFKKDVSEFYDWYFKTKCLEISLTKARRKSGQVNYFNDNGEDWAEFFVRCGRFEHTLINPLNSYQNTEGMIDNYLTVKGNLSLRTNAEVSSAIELQIDTVNSLKNKLRLKGKIFCSSSFIEQGKVCIRGRKSHLELLSDTVQFNLSKTATIEKYGLNRYTFEATVDLVRMNSNQLLPEDIYDLFFYIKLHDKTEVSLVRLGNPTRRAMLFLKDLYTIINKNATIVNPYYTFKLNNLSFEVYNYPLESYKYLKRLLRFSWIVRLMTKHKNVWVVGERIHKAQDTGYSFFKYMRENYPDKNVYYVIDQDSPEKLNVTPYGNELYYKSKKHIWNTVIARKVISSHHPDYLYPLRTPTFKKKIKPDKVFLQHGVMGTKNMVANYGKQAQGFDTDLFMVSSDFEKDMIVHDFGYESKDVFVTGLSRYDQLFKKDVEVKRQVLIIPTWRDWLLTEEKFLKSEYYDRYLELINNNNLHRLSKEYKFDILFCLHPNMQQYRAFFENDYVKVINQSEVNVQYLIKESSLMVTDYSSVGFDFSFLNKPVLYYQFDRNKFIGKRPSHLDLDNDLPGDIAFELDTLLDCIQEYAENDFTMKNINKKRADRFIKYRDQRSSERIYQVIQHNAIKKNFRDNPKYQIIADAVYNKFRKSKNYFPLMKFFYKIGKVIIPVDKRLILFESGVGKQYGDSPKDIYEEILKQGLDYKKVWVYNKQHTYSDSNTLRIKRLSPQYYFYLLRARYWVNNQNFPTYIEKRPQTTYLQTWHGTPLKKMLFDIEKIQGRNESYLDRVGKTIQNWDYLISPSEYATKAFRSAFRYDKEVLETGYPRNDIFYLQDQYSLKRKILNRLHLPKDRKIILYAPTFRDNRTSKNNKFLFDLEMDLNLMKEQLGDEYIILLRMHVIVQKSLKLDESLDGFVYNVSNYPDTQELQLISDVLITDYSSIMFDFVNTGKPILFFTYDLAEYRDNTRGFYINFESEAPGPLVYDTEEIINSLIHLESIAENYEVKYKKFVEKYCLLEDGKASERVVDKVFK